MQVGKDGSVGRGEWESVFRREAGRLVVMKKDEEVVQREMVMAELRRIGPGWQERWDEVEDVRPGAVTQPLCIRELVQRD